jgi:hypothetical protein
VSTADGFSQSSIHKDASGYTSKGRRFCSKVSHFKLPLSDYVVTSETEEEAAFEIFDQYFQVSSAN